ncbi:MAG: DUF1080 domain-containing protein [Bacteroidales bacterium]|nr:DUF1080 domain-containing protein [Bacteroidales bacterium]
MKKLLIVISILAAASLCVAAIVLLQKSSLTFSAAEAAISNGLTLEGSGRQASISGWDSPSQSIQWTAKLRSGNYKVLIRYSQPFFGSAVTIDAGGQQLAALVPPTREGDGFGTMEAGVLAITASGKVTIALHGIQHSIVTNPDGKRTVTGPLPVVSGLTLVPTDQVATSQTLDILKEFNGKSIFDGKTFYGWEPNDDEAMAHFRIEDGIIVGGSLASDLADNHFIRTVRDYRDFELRLKYKVTPTDESYNGGIQIRSQRSTLPGQGCDMVGYQADILARRTGGLYDEKRRSDFLGMELGLPEDYRPDEWNEFIIRCEGPRVRLWLNGVQTTDHIEPYTDQPLEGFGTISQTGRIALQIHKGTPCEVRYKDLLLQEL